MVKKFNTLFSFVHSVVKSVNVGSETKDAPQAQSGLHSRLSSQLKACSAAALLAVGGLADADAAVVHWQNANLLIPNNIDGLYINVETQATGSAGSVVAGWDINPYSATSLTWFNATGTGMMRFPGATTGSAGNLAQGTVIGGAGVTNNGFATSFGSGAVTVGSAPGNWQLNASNYFGFRFKGADGGTKYGWGRFVIGASISGADRMIAEIAYESSGASIVVGAGAVISCTAPSLSGLVTDAGCSGATNGGVDLTATGGSPTPLSYLWSNGAITEDLLNVGPGTYSVTVTAGTCSTSASYTVGTAAQAPQPTGLACYETATYNNTTCQWDVSGTQPAQPSIACYETASFNTTTCSWDVSGTQPAQPSLACYETASFNTTTCSWDVSGTQPAQPTGLASWQTATFNTTTCQWDVSGTPPGAPVGGTVVYDNSASSPMRNAVVVLKQGNTEVVRDTTDATGAFLLPLVAAGNYDVVVTPNTPWGGVNATDAVLILRSFSGSAPLNGIRLTAADVNGSASVNSTDALNALNRFTGALQTFSVGNYAASTSSYTATGTGTGSLNVSMLCYGDANASYQPNGGFVRTSWKDLSTQGVARITSGSYEVPLFVSRGVQPAGVSLELELPEGLRVLGVRASEGLRANQVVYHQEGNRVRMAWLDESGAELKAGDVLCYVQVEGSTEGVWRSSTEVELANVLGEVQPGVELRMPKLSSSLGVMEASVYPNPGRGLRTLSLELSEGMGVAVRVTDALGRTVYTHTAGTLASGTHFLELNMEGWPVGSYQVQVLGATAGGKTHQRSITVLQTR